MRGVSHDDLQKSHHGMSLMEIREFVGCSARGKVKVTNQTWTSRVCTPAVARLWRREPTMARLKRTQADLALTLVRHRDRGLNAELQPAQFVPSTTSIHLQMHGPRTRVCLATAWVASEPTGLGLQVHLHQHPSGNRTRLGSTSPVLNSPSTRSTMMRKQAHLLFG